MTSNHKPMVCASAHALYHVSFCKRLEVLTMDTYV